MELLKSQRSFFDTPEAEPSIDGATFDPKRDAKRLGAQLRSVFFLMRDGRWRTLQEICDETCYSSTAAVSARLRDLRKERFGGHMVERRRGAIEGEWQYRVTANDKGSATVNGKA